MVTPKDIADTGIIHTYFSSTTPHINRNIATALTTFEITDGSTITSTHTYDIDLLGLPPLVKDAKIFPWFSVDALISIRLLRDAGYITVIAKLTITIYLNGTVILRGTNSQSPPLGESI